MNEIGKWAVVAEYKGVAILECTGNVPKSYGDHQYTTDGKTYLWLKGGEQLRTLALESERDVKDYLDTLSDTSGLYSWEEAWQLLIRNDPVRALATYEGQLVMRRGTDYEWDEARGHFVLPPPKSIRDGQHRFNL
jgi:hypothetical protein